MTMAYDPHADWRREDREAARLAARIEITRYRSTYAWETGLDGSTLYDEPTELDNDADTFTLDRREFTAGALMDELAHTLAECIEASSSDWSPRVWYIVESYQHPYTGEIEESTYHLTGLTDDESRELYRRITAR